MISGASHFSSKSALFKQLMTPGCLVPELNEVYIAYLNQVNVAAKDELSGALIKHVSEHYYKFTHVQHAT